MATERKTKDEYNYITFESLVRALAAIQEMFHKCELTEVEIKRYIDIKQRLDSITYDILEMSEKDS